MAGESGGTAATTARVEETLAWLASWDPSQAAGEELGAAALDGERLLNAVHAWSATLLEAFERDGDWAADGALSAAGWVAERTGTSAGTVRARVRQGTALRLLPALAELARSGRLPVEHLRALGDCACRHPGLAAEHELVLVEAATTLDADRFRLMARHWLSHAADADAPHPGAGPADTAAGAGDGADHGADHGAGDDPVEQLSRLYASRTVEGCLRLDGWFVPADADLIDAALGAGVDRQLRAAANGDPSVAGRPVPALRAEALVDLAAQSMRREPSDLSAPDRYRVAVVVRPGAATNPPEAACDSVAYRAVLGEKSEVLDIGHQSARWPPAIRRAVTLRDRGCVFPACDRPPSWADIHHCTPFSEQGRTSVDNGALLCRRHHTFVHARHWRVTIEHGTAVVRRPDGQPHVIQRWSPSPDIAGSAPARGSPTSQAIRTATPSRPVTGSKRAMTSGS
jgi:hypothetical protein